MQLETEDLREEMVQLVPLAGVVDRHEQVGPLELGQDRAGSRSPDDGIAERRVHPAEYRRPQDKLADLRSQEVEHVVAR